MIKLFYVFPSVNTGGAEKAAIIVANELIKSGEYNITFLICDNSSFFIPLINTKIEIIRLNLPCNQSYLRKLWYSYFVIPSRLHQLLKVSDYDFVISIYEHDAEIPIILKKAFFFWGIGKKKVKSVSIIQNSLYGKSKHCNFKRRLLIGAIDKVRKYFFNYIIVVSSHIEEELKQSNIDTCQLIHNPIDDETIDKKMFEIIASNIMEEIGRDYFLCISRIAIQKNIIFLLRAFLSIVNKTSLNLVILGENSEPKYYNTVMKFICKNNLTGRVKHLKGILNPYPLIRNAKIIVNTSFYEGTPLAILEALYIETPILSTNFIGHEETLTSSNSTICFSNNEIEFGRMMLESIEKSNVKRNNSQPRTTKYSSYEIAKCYDSFFRLS